MNLGCLQEQQVLLTSESSLAPKFLFAYIYFLNLVFCMFTNALADMWGSKQNTEKLIFVFTIWDPGVESRSLVFIATTFTHSAVSLALNYFLLLFFWFFESM